MNEFDRILEGYMPYGDNPFKLIQDRKVVFFDTETTGFKPGSSQITEIGAIMLDGNSLREEDRFHRMVELDQNTLTKMHDPAKSNHDLSISDILKMTGYHDQSGDRIGERAAIDEFHEFIPEKAVLVAHNAKFDMKMVNARAKITGTMPIRKYSKVLDTMIMSQQFFIPMSQELEMNDEIDINAKATAKKHLDGLTTRWTKTGKRQMISSRLGDLATALKGGIENWHSAIADVQTTISIFLELKEFFDKNFNSELKFNNDFVRRYSRKIQQRR
jgi:DNA polymerase III alpha subunit (gram-positive type)